MDDTEKRLLKWKGYSDAYIAAKKKAEATWPKWRIDFYNNCVAISAHAKKLNQSRDLQ